MAGTNDQEFSGDPTLGIPGINEAGAGLGFAAAASPQTTGAEAPAQAGEWLLSKKIEVRDHISGPVWS